MAASVHPLADAAFLCVASPTPHKLNARLNASSLSLSDNPLIMSKMRRAINQTNVIVNALTAKLAVSPLFTVRFAVRSAHAIRLPPELASKIAKATTVPQFAEAVGKVITVPLLFDVGDVPLAFGKFVVLFVTPTRA